MFRFEYLGLLLLIGLGLVLALPWLARDGDSDASSQDRANRGELARLGAYPDARVFDPTTTTRDGVRYLKQSYQALATEQELLDFYRVHLSSLGWDYNRSVGPDSSGAATQYFYNEAGFQLAFSYESVDAGGMLYSFEIARAPDPDD